MTFTEAVDMVFTIKCDAEDIRKLNIPISMLTDSHSVFDVRTKLSTTGEKRLMTNLHSVKDAYRCFEGNDAALIRTENIIAETLPKVMGYCAITDTLNLKKFNSSAEQWIIRRKDREAKATDKESLNAGV